MKATQRIVAGAAIGLALLTWAGRGHGQSGGPAPLAVPATDWPSYGLTAGETRFSPLAQIDRTNVSRLGRAWSTQIGDGAYPQEATPIVVDGTMYVVTSWSVTIALDAATGRERWRWDPKVDQTIAGAGTNRICCGVVNRGVAYDRGKVFVPVIDGRLVALDAATGTPVWSAQATPKDDIAYSLTIAPRIVRGKVIVGNSGAEFPPYRGYFSAFDAESGHEVWRFYTVPGDPSKPFEHAALAAAAKTWSGQWWKYGGGGSVWDGLAYDPDANLLYVGTGNPAPWPAASREAKQGDDNLYTCSILAVDPDTGQLKWHYQTVPGDQWDYDGTAQLLLADLPIQGVTRKVVMQAHKNGFFYVIDRLTGAFISAEPFTGVSWARGIDRNTGRPLVNPEANYGTAPVTVAPSGGGAHTWTPMSFNPATGLAYFNAQIGSTFTYAAISPFAFTPGVMNLGVSLGRGRGAAVEPGPTPQTTGPAGQGAYLVAWDPATQQARWRQPGGGGGGTLATAGGLVFQSISDGRLVAYTADAGVLQFTAPLTLRGIGPPMTYAAGGKQYVAVVTPGPPRVTALTLDGEHIEPPARPAP